MSARRVAAAPRPRLSVGRKRKTAEARAVMPNRFRADLAAASPLPPGAGRARGGHGSHGMIRYTGYLHEKGRSRIYAERIGISSADVARRHAARRVSGCASWNRYRYWKLIALERRVDRVVRLRRLTLLSLGRAFKSLHLDAPRDSRSRGRSHSDVSAQRVKVRPCRCPSTGRGGRRTRHVSHVTRDSRCA